MNVNIYNASVFRALQTMFILAQPPGQQKLKTVDPAVFLCPAARGFPRPFFYLIYNAAKMEMALSRLCAACQLRLR
jgi:hypothetical protein